MDSQWKCSKTRCDIRAAYTFVQGPGQNKVFRCIHHMAMDISKILLANSELRTIQKVD